MQRKLTNAQVAEIRRRYLAYKKAQRGLKKDSPAALSREFGVDRDYIRQVAEGMYREHPL